MYPAQADMRLEYILRVSTGFVNGCEEGWDQLGQVRHLVRGRLALCCAGSCFANVRDDLDFGGCSLNQTYRVLVRECSLNIPSNITFPMRRMLCDFADQLGDLGPFVLAARVVKGIDIALRFLCFSALAKTRKIRASSNKYRSNCGV